MALLLLSLAIINMWKPPKKFGVDGKVNDRANLKEIPHCVRTGLIQFS
jgi:hypothetical protein